MLTRKMIGVSAVLLFPLSRRMTGKKMKVKKMIHLLLWIRRMLGRKENQME